MWKAISGLVGAFLIYLFLEEFRLNKPLAILLSLLSLIPLIRLIVVVALCLTWKAKDSDPQNLAVTPLGDRLKNITLLFVGYVAIYNFIFGTTGVLFLSAEEAVISNLLRVLISAIFFYFIYKRKIYLNQTDFLGYVVISTFLAFFLFM